MNNTFNIQRFGLLLKRQWLEYGKIYLISLAVLLGIFLAFYGFQYYTLTHYNTGAFNRNPLVFRVILFLITGLIFITIIASSYFAHLGQKSRAIIDLMIPASTFEKLVASIFYTSVLSISSFLLLFYLTDLAFVTKLRSWYEHSGNNMFLDGKKVELAQMFPFFVHEDNGKDRFDAFFVLPFLFTSVFLLGSIYFEKFHYIKTAISVMIFSGIWTAIVAKAGQELFRNKIPIDGNTQIQHAKNGIETGMIFLLIALTLIFWAITYVRLKEKEV
jgi:hypothetical protein